ARRRAGALRRIRRGGAAAARGRRRAARLPGDGGAGGARGGVLGPGAAGRVPEPRRLPRDGPVARVPGGRPPAHPGARAPRAAPARPVNLGGIEAGGTHWNCAVGDGGGTVAVAETFATTTPAETIGRVVEFFERQAPLDALGVGCFGPVELDRASPRWGQIT